MVFKNLCILVLWTKLALALEGLSMNWLNNEVSLKENSFIMVISFIICIFYHNIIIFLIFFIWRRTLTQQLINYLLTQRLPSGKQDRWKCEISFHGSTNTRSMAYFPVILLTVLYIIHVSVVIPIMVCPETWIPICWPSIEVCFGGHISLEESCARTWE